MILADKKKKSNIAEYIIHMYQTEDLIRVFECDIEKIKEYVIKHIPEDDSSKEDMAIWYSDLLSKMTQQGILKEGHLQEINEIVVELELLKEQLLISDNEFKRKYDEAKSDITEMKSLSNGLISSDVQVCLNGIYGLLIAKINGREIPKEFQAALDKFGNVLSHLSFRYSQEDYLTNN